jgi:SAM-dependent methyltransferase
VNPFERIPRLYDWEHDPFRDDVELHLALARRFGGPILELACGTGRILAPLAATGFDCTGVDSEPEMLARARERLAKASLRVRLEQQRLETLELDSRFRTILFPLDSLGLLLDRPQQIAALRAARRHVTHDGRLVVDVSNGNLRGGNEAPEEFLHHLTAPDPDTGRPITKWAVRRPHPAEQLDELTFFYDEQDESGCVRRTTTDLRLRWFTRFELELLLEAASWRVEELYGDYGLGGYGPTSDRIIVVAGPGAPSLQ